MLWLRPGRQSRRIPAQPAAASPIWGDGFEDDTFRDMASVGDWDDLSDDELLRLYPRLLHQTPPPRLLAYSERCVAALSFRSFASPVPGLRSIVFDPRLSPASAHGSAWASEPTEGHPVGLAEDELRLLDEMLGRLRAGDEGTFALERAELFAFHTGVHPAYFWPEAIATHQRLTTFGWLGVVMRGRSALMSRDVAEYLDEAIPDLDGDCSLARSLGSRRMASILARHAAIRLQGREVVFSAPARCAP